MKELDGIQMDQQQRCLIKIYSTNRYCRILEQINNLLFIDNQLITNFIHMCTKMDIGSIKIKISLEITQANIVRNYKKSISGLFEDDLNHLFMQNKKQMKQLKEIQKKQLYIISNLQVQTKIHIQLSSTIQNITLYIKNKPQIDGGEKFGDKFQQFISGLRPDCRTEILKEIFGTEFMGFSPVPFQFR